MTSASRRFRPSLAAIVLSLGAPLLIAAAPPTAPVPLADATAGTAPEVATPPAPVETPKPLPQQISVAIDQTRTLDLEQSVATLSVGNPSIADASIQSGNHLFLLGKSFGRTNVVALDSNGKTVLNMTVFVTSAGSVTVFKGNRQLTYNCAPNCERALMPGDSKDDFETLSGQINSKTSMGTSAGGRE
jgi:Pilus formation protein N terminal region